MDGPNISRCALVAHYERSRGEVPEALIALGGEDAHNADAVEHRQEVDDTQEVPYGTGHEPHRAPTGAYDPYAERPFPYRAPPPKGFEEDVVSEQDEEDPDDPQSEGEQRRSLLVDDGTKSDHAGEATDQPHAVDERHLYEPVEEGRREARAQPRQGNVELDSLRRGHRDAIFVLHVMNLERFLREREPVWIELESLAARAHGRPERLGAQGAARLGELYRGCAADLALARRRWPGDPVVARLERATAQGRQLVYGGANRRGSPLAFFSRRYWQIVRHRPVPLLVAALLLFGPGLLAGQWAVTDPGAASTFVPDEFSGVSEPRPEGGDLGLSGGEQAAFSSMIFTNNIRVSFLAFAGGILAGLGTGFVLVFNGVTLGAVSGLAVGAGNGRLFFELVAPHGVLELSCIVVTAAAGLRLGWAMVDPGRRRRGRAVVEEGRTACEIVLGTAPWLVLAGLVEGFVTPTGLGMVPAVIFGTLLGAAYWMLVVLRGKRPEVTDAPGTSP